MAIINEKKERRLIPNWRDFSTTISLGELDASSITPIVKPNLSIENYIEDFRENESVPFAADLLSAAVVNGFTDKKEVKNAAQYIFDRKNQVTQSQFDISKNILSTNDDTPDCEIGKITIKQLAQCLPEQEYRDKIKHLKQYVIDFPYNPIAWVELSRCYSILGQERQAVRTMKIAIQLAPDNRFVLRCAVRLFAHYNEVDLSHDILRRKNAINFDPWLMSAEISVANLRGRNSRFIKRGIELIESKNLSPFSISELASSIGTIELLSGDRKKSRKMFNKSLIAPNDNSLAQIEWILNSKDKTLIDRKQITFQPKFDFEAQALSNFYDKKLIDALNNTCQWFCDMPFSKRPVILGSGIAALLDNRALSIDFLKLGLMAHSTDPQMLNNIAYYLSLENNTQEAKKYIEKVNWNGLSKLSEICLGATQGLICFRESKIEEGRQFYLKAIEEAGCERDKYNMSIALLNYAREELIAKTDQIESVMQAVSKIPEISDDDIALKKLKEEVSELYKKHKQ
jgi:tetratricopeptide (TPR) repeat protein